MTLGPTTLEPRQSARLIAPIVALAWVAFMIGGLLGPYPLPAAIIFALIGAPLLASVAQSVATYELTDEGVERRSPVGTRTLPFAEMKKVVLKRGRAGIRTVTVVGRRSKLYFDNGRSGFDPFVSEMIRRAQASGVDVRTGLLSGKVEDWL